MAGQERDVLERAVRVVSEQAAKPDELVDEAIASGLDGSHPVTIHAKMLRLELLKVKADLERHLGQLVPRLLRVWANGSLDRRAQHEAGALGASGAGAARRARDLNQLQVVRSIRLTCSRRIDFSP